MPVYTTEVTRAMARDKINSLAEDMAWAAQQAREIQLTILNGRENDTQLTGDEFVLFSDVECAETDIVNVQRRLEKAQASLAKLMP